MNKSMLPKLEGQRVRLRPIPRQLTKESLGRPSDDLEFIVRTASHEGLSLYDIFDQGTLEVPADHIREYLSDGERGGIKRGIIHLKVRWYFRGHDAWFDPAW